MTDSDPLYVDCGPHGQRIATVVCRHMINGSDAPLGFIENTDDPNDLQAWCHACEEMFNKKGDRTDAFLAFNNMGIFCVVCYAEFQTLHTIAADQ